MRKQTHNKLIKKTYEDQVQQIKVVFPAEKDRVSRIVGSFLVILSGVVLYTDRIFNIFNIEFNNLYGYYDSQTLVWTFCQTLSPIVLMLGMYLRPYFVTLAIPIFCYSLQFYFIIKTSLTNDNPLVMSYALFTTIILMFIVWFLKQQTKKLDDLRNIKIDLLEEIYNSKSS